MTVPTRVCAVGDIWFGDHPVRIGHGVRSSLQRRGTDNFFSPVADFFGGADIRFGNLESVLSDKGLEMSSLRSSEMRGFPGCIDPLLRVNFNVLNVANNHMMQHGIEAFEETIRLLTHSGIGVVGIDGNETTSELILDIHGETIIFLGYSLHREDYYKDTPPYSLRASYSDVLAEVREIRRNRTGTIICSLHWGSEFVPFPGGEQVALGRELINAGVTLVLGHHPHVLQRIESYGSGLIAYSLGNFVFDLWPSDTRRSAILHVDLVNGRVVHHHITPIFINSHFQPVPATGDIADLIRKRTHHSPSLSPHIEPGGRQYEDIAKDYSASFRWSSYRYFISNLWRYTPTMIVQSVSRTLGRRILAG